MGGCGCGIGGGCCAVRREVFAMAEVEDDALAVLKRRKGLASQHG